MNLLEQINAEIAEMQRKQQESLEFEKSLQSGLQSLPKKAKKRQGRPPKVSNEIFADVWKMCLNEGGLKEVAQRLGMSEACAAVKACNMRKAGYDIPKLRRGRPRKIQE